jgi:hypothetical protein
MDLLTQFTRAFQGRLTDRNAYYARVFPHSSPANASNTAHLPCARRAFGAPWGGGAFNALVIGPAPVMADLLCPDSGSLYAGSARI